MFKEIHIFRVEPGQELLNGIASYCHEHEIFSAAIIGIIGSGEDAKVNFLKALPKRYDSVDYCGPLEIVCAQGPIIVKDDTPIIHIYIQLSGQDPCSGGHFVQKTVFSTAGVALGALDYQLRCRPTATQASMNCLIRIKSNPLSVGNSIYEVPSGPI